MITVISTAAVAVGGRCLDTVGAQRGVELSHACYAGGAPKLAHVSECCSLLPSDAIVAMVDGDDWLAHVDALADVIRLHRGGAWLTYGSFRYADGRPGFAAPVLGAPRRAAWSSTHLVTFRAGLFRAIGAKDLQRDGAWLELATDVAMVIPMLEMAGERAVFDPYVHYVYDLAASWEWGASAPQRLAELEAVAWVRARQPYTRLERLP